jgi:hypothetical protein
MSSHDLPAGLSARARRLGSVLEPVTGQVYFSPECHANYVALGFDASSAESNGVALPDGSAYFTSRGSVMGQVPGEVVAAAFGVFNREVVIPMVQLGWTRHRRGDDLRSTRRRCDRTAAPNPRRRAGGA